MNILINGIKGYMGREVEKLCTDGYRGASYAVGVDPFATTDAEHSVFSSLKEVPQGIKVDCIVDFSRHDATPDLLKYASERKIPVVLATTGHTESELKCISAAAPVIPIFYSANMSLGIALLVELAKTTALAMPEAEIEIIEKHHDRKLDAPSGTALMLANEIISVRPEAYVNTSRSGHGKRTKEEIGIHAIRMGNIVGEHDVIIGTANQTITLSHQAHSRALFAEGALVAAEYIIGKAPGVYDMKSLLSKT